MTTETRLLLSALGAVVLLVVLVIRFKISSFLALVIASLSLGLATGMKLPSIAKAFQDGMGAVLGAVAGIIALGTILGKMLAESGGAQVIATTIARGFGKRMLPWAMLVIGLLVGLPVFFSVGLILLTPLLFALAREHRTPVLLLGIPMIAGLSAMHGLVPPHPGIMAAVPIIKADVGRTMLLSLVVALPAAILAGLLFARLFARTAPLSAETAPAALQTAPLRFSVAVGTVLFPIVLMLASGVADMFLAAESKPRAVLAFVGHPTVALLLGVLVSFRTFGSALGVSREKILKMSEDSLGSVALMLLVVGAGGGFSRVLIESGVGAAVESLARAWQLSPIPMGYAAACLIRIATGSATVAITTAAGLVAPLASATPGTDRELLLLAMGAGSLILSHVNDGGFWFVKESLKLTVAETFKTWTVLETLLSLIGFAVVLMLDWLI